MEFPEGSVFIAYRVAESEGFDSAAETIMKMLYQTQYNYPAEPRVLIIDIDGHKDENGDYDEDMMELQTQFLVAYASKYVRMILMPDMTKNNSYIINPTQRNDVPSRFAVAYEGEETIVKDIMEMDGGSMEIINPRKLRPQILTIDASHA